MQSHLITCGHTLKNAAAPYNTQPHVLFFYKKAETFCVELNLRKQKWLTFSRYNHHKHLIKDYLLQFRNAIDFYSKSYENIILLSDFNVEISDCHMNSFCAIYHFKSLIKEPTFITVF